MIKPFGEQRGEPERIRPITREPNQPPDLWHPDFSRVRPVICTLTPEQHIVSERHHQHTGAEQLRLVRHRIEKQRRERKRLRILLVTSAAPQEGKTTIASNLALTLAGAHARVLLIDGDLRHRGLDKVFERGIGPGLAECLAQKITITDALRRIEPTQLYVLRAGPVGADPDLLHSPHLADLLEASATVFDWTVVDSPPLLPFADGHRLAELSDAVVMVARAGMTRPRDFERALRSLDGIHIAGTILNDYDDPNERAYYERYAKKARATRGPGTAR